MDPRIPGLGTWLGRTVTSQQKLCSGKCVLLNGLLSLVLTSVRDVLLSPRRHFVHGRLLTSARPE